MSTQFQAPSTAGRYLLYADIESNDTKQGDGPLPLFSAEFTYRLSQAGSFSISVPADEPRLAHVINKRILRVFMASLEPGLPVIELGAGIVDSKTINLSTGRVVNIKGPDELAELGYRLVSGNFYNQTAYTPYCRYWDDDTDTDDYWNGDVAKSVFFKGRSLLCFCGVGRQHL